jgi:hypothetical protein
VDSRQDAPAQALGLGDGAHARLAQSDDAEFGGHEKSIQHNENKGQQD